MQTTLKTIAEKAGVSYQTVWRALHGEGRVSSKTQARIRAIAEEMNYRTNRFAAGLRTNRSGTIGLIVLDVSNSFTGSLTRAIEKKARAEGYSVFLANSDGDIVRERDAVLDMIDNRVDGLIISGAEGDHHYLLDELPNDFPIVWVNKPLPELGVAGVASQNYQIGDTAAEYLTAHGHRAIGGFFGPFGNTPFKTRHDGLVDALLARGLEYRKEWFVGGENSVEFARQAFLDLWRLDHRPTAVLATSYRLTEGVLAAIQELGLERNRDIEVLGFDIQYAELLRPPMAVFRQQYDEFARRALAKLLARIEGHSIDEEDDLPVPLCKPRQKNGCAGVSPLREDCSGSFEAVSEQS